MTQKYPFSVDPQEFSGKRVLITGGTKGLGASMVQRFALSGAKLAITARTPASDTPDSALFIAADVATAEGVQTVQNRIQQAWGGLDILVNNVGGSETFPGGFEALSDEYWLKMFNWNFMTSVRLDRAFLPGMIERKSGALIHIGTVWHRISQSDSSIAYSAIKAALASYSKGLSKAAAPHGVRVNMVSPGFIETESATVWIEHIAASNGVDMETARQQLIARSGGIPMGRTGRPAEIAELVAFVASERAGFTSGVDYTADGGACPTV